MKLLNRWMAVFIGIAWIVNAHGQGTITFDHPLYGGINYSQLGMGFGVVIPTQGTGSIGGVPGYPTHDGFVVDNGPNGGTLYMLFYQQFSPDDYVNFSLINGDSFGLASVQLADPNSPSLSPVAILFKGYKSGGVTVTQTFTTPGGGATTFQNYLFNSDFASGLTSVDILSTRWAMDNLVVVPEPSTLTLLSLGGLFLGWRWRKAARK